MRNPIELKKIPAYAGMTYKDYDKKRFVPKSLKR